MNEHIEKRIVAFTSQALRQQGIRAVRMDDIAKSMNISKRTIYQVYETKDNLISTCLESYAGRMENIFQLIKCNHEDALVRLWEVFKAYVDYLYRGEYNFWMDISRHSEYQYIYTTYNRIWSAELEKNLLACQKEGYIIESLDRRVFFELFSTLLYKARINGTQQNMLYNSAYLLLRGIATKESIDRLNEAGITYLNIGCANHRLNIHVTAM